MSFTEFVNRSFIYLFFVAAAVAAGNNLICCYNQHIFACVDMLKAINFTSRWYLLYTRLVFTFRHFYICTALYSTVLDWTQLDSNSIEFYYLLFTLYRLKDSKI